MPGRHGQWGPATPKRLTIDGVTYERKDRIFVKEQGQFVVCCPYDNHWIYENKRPYESSFKCTCGSPAVIMGMGAKAMLVCLLHATTGRHSNTGS